ncbi:MAG: hypothetical protein QOI61_595 [Actinomycetota bacterium]
MRGTWPLVGRNEERSVIDDILRRDDSSGVVLAGLPGVGKTRLIHETLNADADVQTLYIAATRSAAVIPFGAFASLLADLPDRGRAERTDILHDLLAVLQTRATAGRLIVAVDDAHLLDDSSAALVSELVGHPEIAVLLTVRAGELAPDAITALWKDGGLVRLELQSLAPDEVDALIGLALPGPVAPDTKAQLWSRSGGNPLMLRETIDDALQTHRLSQETGAWHWSSDAGPGPRLVDVISSQLGRLDGPELQLAELVAVGEQLDVAMVTALLPAAPLAECERRGLVRILADGALTRVQLAQPLYGEVLRARLPVFERNRLRRLLADQLEANAATAPADVLRLATWRLENGDSGHGDVYGLGAAAANALFDHVLAERLAREAIAERAEFDAVLTLAEALSGQGRYLEADEVLQGLECVSDAQQLRRATARVRCLAWGLCDFGQAKAAVIEAREAVTDPQAVAFLNADLATLLLAEGRVLDSLAIAEPIFEDTALEDAARARTLGTITAGWTSVGRSADAIGAAEKWLAPAMRLHAEVPEAVGWAMGGLINGRFGSGELEQHGALLDGAAALANLGRSQRGYVYALRGRHALTCGRLQFARELLLIGVSELRPMGGIHLPYCLALLGHVHSLLAEDEAARFALHESGVAARGRALSAIALDDVRIATAWVAAAEGKLSVAGELAADAADAALAGGRYFYELIARHEAVRLGRTDQLERLETLGDIVDGLWPEPCRLHARAIADDDGVSLDDASELFETMGAMLLAAECASEAARAHGSSGLKARATASAARAERLLQLCEGARTPALRFTSSPVRLSRREREVAELATRGLSNKTIAETLHVSVRTVEGHLYQAFAKLGVTTREDIASALRD